MFIVTYRKVFYGISIVLVALSIGSMFIWGLNTGIDFKGGSLLEVVYTTARPDVPALQEQLKDLSLGEYSARPTGEAGYVIRLKEINQEQKNAVITALKSDGATLEEKQFSSIGPMLGTESRNKSFIAIGLVLVSIILFIAFVFRKVSKPISSWIYGVVAIVGLIHNIIIPTGVFAVLGHFSGVEIDTLFVTALLVILGFSVHDTIVVFDRVRENLRRDENKKKTFEQIVGESINQTFVRSMNTSLTVIFPLIVLYVVGSEATANFVLALLIGVIAGTYSSLFVGSPLLVTIANWMERRAKI